MQSDSYIFSSNIGVWQRELKNSLNYSDGGAVEERLLEQLKVMSDVSCKSDELFSHIDDWPSEYHFSRVRHNLLRPFIFGQADHILELGAGCGNLTRYLGETGATVVAVEGAQARAAIIAERCRDLHNVKIYQDNLQYFSAQQKFSVVTLIGVLEYSRLFIKANDPVLTCLSIAKNHLDDNGVLYLAIENQLGLKYFNGMNEDHIGKPFFGINDLYTDTSVVTFGKTELTTLLQQAGFVDVEFFYPFPDYKLPTIILSEYGLQAPEFAPDHLLARATARDYTGSPWRQFAEPLAYEVLARNKLLGELSNSFMVTARLRPAVRQSNWLAKSFSVHRQNTFCTETNFIQSEQQIIVEKKPLFELSPKPLSKIFSINLKTHQPYLRGKLYFTGLFRVEFADDFLTALVDWYNPWINFLVSHCVEKDKNAFQDFEIMTLPGHFIDCNPLNLIETKQGKFTYIDAEWESLASIPLSWVVSRGILHTLGLLANHESINQFTYLSLTQKILEELNIKCSVEKVREYFELEKQFLDFCLPTMLSKNFDNSLSQKIGNVKYMYKYIDKYRDQINTLKVQVQISEKKAQEMQQQSQEWQRIATRTYVERLWSFSKRMFLKLVF